MNPAAGSHPVFLSPQSKSAELTKHILHDSFIDILKGVYKYEIAIEYANDNKITSDSPLTSRMNKFLTYCKQLFGTTDDNVVIRLLTDNKGKRSIARASGITKTRARQISEFAFAHLLMGFAGHWVGATVTGGDSWAESMGGTLEEDTGEIEGALNRGEGVVGPVHDLAVSLGDWMGGKFKDKGLEAKIPSIGGIIQLWGSHTQDLLVQSQLKVAYDNLCAMYSDDTDTTVHLVTAPLVPNRRVFDSEQTPTSFEQEPIQTVFRV